MTQQELTQAKIIEGNKLMAEFHGYIYYGLNDERLQGGVPGWKLRPFSKPYTKHNVSGYLCRSHKGLKYHSKFDNWLMPVWYKFRDLEFDNFDDYEIHVDYKYKIIFAIVTKTITEAFTELSAGIKWYNEIKKPTSGN